MTIGVQSSRLHERDLCACGAGVIYGSFGPVSLSHVCSALNSGAGAVGWRRPGVFGYHVFGSRSGLNLEVDWEVGRANWADSGKTSASSDANGIGQSYAGNGGDPYGFNLGEASGLPAVEARVVIADGTLLQAFVAGHYSKVDRSGFGAVSGDTGTQDLLVLAGSGGAKAVIGPATLAGAAYAGRNPAPLGGAFLQFQGNSAGNVAAYGGWAQVGLDLIGGFSAWAFAGFEKLDEKQAIAAKFTKLRNVNTTLVLRYRLGDYAVSAEWVRLRTRLHVYASSTVSEADARAIGGDFTGNQWLLTANYSF